MSAADPHGPDQPDRPVYPGTVLPFPASRPRRHPPGERTTVPAQPDGSLSPQERLAATFEAVFASQGRTLTDEHTATDVRIALGEVRRLLAGALERGLLDDGQFRTLDTMVEGMEAVPALLG